ncbi:MAG: DNA polymerase [Methylococcaceae bacterium]|nr:DNA polymerase [Methylococcaceae bacterium]
MALQICTLDFESFYSSTYSLSKLTTEEYVMGDEFEAIGFSIKLGTHPTEWFSGSREYLQDILDRFDWDNIALVCHNTFFDATILSFHFGIYAAKYIDTLSMARAVHGIDVGGSLAKLVLHYGLGEKGTEIINALGKHRKDFSWFELERYGAYCINDTELTYGLLMKLLPHFTIIEMSLIDITIKMAVQPVLEADYEMLEEHLIEVKLAKQELLDRIVVDKKEIMSNNKFAKLLEDCGVEPPMKVSPTTGKMTYAFAKTDDGLKDLLEHENLMVQTLVAVRLGVKSSIEETRTERLMGIIARLGVLPVPLNYYSAATGRWAAGGGQKVNFQNFPRKSKIKEAIHAPKGYVIVGSDLSNIELRVGLCLAGAHAKLKLLGAGFDLYKDFASNVFDIHYEAIDADHRFIGKTSQLSLIFGVGALKLQRAIKAGIGIDIGFEEACRIVEVYREEEYPEVKAAWKECGRAIKQMTNDQHGILGYNDLLTVEGKAGIRFPSGLYMKYPQLHVEKGTNGYDEHKYKLRNGWDKLYPGKLFNNVVQGLARCIMGEAMVRISKQRDIALTIHDAVYCVVPEAEAQEASDFMTQEMTRTPIWMPGIPLAVENHIGYTLAG